MSDERREELERAADSHREVILSEPVTFVAGPHGVAATPLEYVAKKLESCVRTTVSLTPRECHELALVVRSEIHRLESA